MLHITLSSIWPTDILYEPSRLSEREIDARDPWAGPSQDLLKSFEVSPFNQVFCLIFITAMMALCAVFIVVDAPGNWPGSPPVLQQTVI